MARVDDGPAHRGAALVFLLTCLFSAWMWISLDAPSSTHDEAATVLQARIFAAGSFSAPPPPIPEFFQQFHVLVEPRLAPKYWPGHGLVLVAGVLLGLPALVPVLLTGLAGSILYSLGRRIAGPAVAAIGWSLWLTGPQLAVWRTTYLPVTTSTALWLLGALFLERYWRQRRTVDLGLLAVSAAALAITRPLTAVAFLLPVIPVVLAAIPRQRRWRTVAKAAAIGAPVLVVVPLWSLSSTGSAWLPPYLAYQLVPAPSFSAKGRPTDPSTAAPFVPPDIQALSERYAPLGESFSVRVVPKLFVGRVQKSFVDLYSHSPWRLALIPFFFVGVLALPRTGRFAVGWPLALYLLHAPRPHFTYWSVYYVETLGIIALTTAAGVCWAAQRISPRSARAAGSLATLAAVVWIGVSAFDDCAAARRRLAATRAPFEAFERLLAGLPERERTIVFIRYSPSHDPARAFVRNPPDYGRARHWLVYDRGPANADLLALSPDRKPYLFDEASFRLLPLGGSGDGAEAAAAGS